MNKMREYIATFLCVVAIMSMVGATGAVEADNYFVGNVNVLMKMCATACGKE